MKKVAITGSFDNINSQVVRFLNEAAKFGYLQLLLWDDDAVRQMDLS